MVVASLLIGYDSVSISEQDNKTIELKFEKSNFKAYIKHDLLIQGLINDSTQ